MCSCNIVACVRILTERCLIGRVSVYLFHLVSIAATSLCFNESDVFTAEVLAIVINQLLEQSPLPTLLMRTVIQTLALHPKLSGFIMNTLSRLVNKQVSSTNVLFFIEVFILYLLHSYLLSLRSRMKPTSLLV